MTDPNPESSTDPSLTGVNDEAGDFMLRVARVLSGARRETLFEDLTRAAAELLGADLALIGRYIDDGAVPSLETLASHGSGEITPEGTYPIAGTPCETVIGKAFQFYPEALATRFPDADVLEHSIVGYAAYPLCSDDDSALGLFSVMSTRPLKDPARIESLLRIFSERVVAEMQRSNAEDELRESEERYRSIFDASVDGLALLSPEGRIVDVNAAMEKLYGYDRSEMIGEKALRFARGPSRENAAQFLRTVRDENYAVMVDKAYHRDGTEFFIEPRGVTVDYRGRRHILAIIRDVTARTVAEQQRAALETQLRQAQKMEAIGHLTGGVAHDFNNILTSVLGYVELAHDHVEVLSDNKLNRYLERAQRSGERARDLIQQMLTFTRGQPGEPRAMSIGPVVGDTIALLESMVPATIRISCSIEPGLPTLVIDPVHIEQVLINLCLNARDAMPGGGSLDIRVGQKHCAGESCSACHADAQGEFVAIEVRDSGHGMSPELIDRVFEPFFSTKETGKGSGMGLSTVHGIVHEYGGHISVDSVPGEGAGFAVLLPVASEETVAEAAHEQGFEAPAQPRLRGEVLLIDDNQEVAEFVTDLLTSWGLVVNVFNDGEAAYKHFLARPDAYRFAVVDQTMPAVTGIRLSGQFRLERPELPIVLYTGYSDEVDDRIAEEAGIYALLRKPLDINELKRVVSAILE